MRIKVTFKRRGRQRMLPMDYQYYISAWIYKVIRNADEDFADFFVQNNTLGKMGF